MENELMFQKRKTGPGYLQGGNGLSKTTADSKGFQKPQLNLDPTKIKVNSKFDDIPDNPQGTQTKILPSKPKAIKPISKKDLKVEKPLTEKLTNIAIDTKTMTAHNVERKIDRLRADPKELTQKPNFGRFQAPQSVDENPYV